MSGREEAVKGRHLRSFYFWLMVAFVPWTVLLTPLGPSVLEQLGRQVWYVTFISHVAFVVALMSSWQGARVEVKQDGDS